MNEKKFFIFVVCILLFCFSGCSTTRSGIYDNRAGAGAVRSDLQELGERQANAAITSTELKGEIDRSLDEVGRLEQSINGIEGSLEEFRTILERIRRRKRASDSGKAGGD